jgi:hypothetical protein
MDYTFESETEAINSLVGLENQYWCRHCKSGLFFHSQCRQLPRL